MIATEPIDQRFHSEDEYFISGTTKNTNEYEELYIIVYFVSLRELRG